MGGACSSMGEMRNVYNILVRKPAWKRPLEKPTRRWEDNGMHLGEVGLEGVDCIHLAQDRDQWRALVDTVMKLRVP
jgi:hypothetical protein